LVSIFVHVVTSGQAGLVLARLMFFTGSIYVHAILLFNQPFRSTQSGYPSVGRCNGYQARSV